MKKKIMMLAVAAMAALSVSAQGEGVDAVAANLYK